jgi:hypothetical protein
MLTQQSQRFGDVSVEQLVEEWDSELEVLERRARMRIIRTDQLEGARAA